MDRLDTIRKLKAKADATEGTPEGRTFRSAVRRLMKKWGIKSKDLKATRQEVGVLADMLLWQRALVDGCSIAYGCKVVREDGRVYFEGTMRVTQPAMSTYRFYERKIPILAHLVYGPIWRDALHAAYAFGYAAQIVYNVEQQKAHRERRKNAAREREHQSSARPAPARQHVPPDEVSDDLEAEPPMPPPPPLPPDEQKQLECMTDAAPIRIGAEHAVHEYLDDKPKLETASDPCTPDECQSSSPSAARPVARARRCVDRPETILCGDLFR